MSNLLVVAFAFVLGFVSAIALIHIAARHLAEPPRPLARRRLAIRRPNADRLPARVQPDWITEVNAIVQEM